VPGPLSVEEALTQVLARATPLAAETVALDAAAGRVLAAAPPARTALPPFASSAMDGFAVRAADCPATLSVEVRIPAGRPAGRSLAQGEAMGIATGGVVPEGADAVVPIEHVVDRDDSVEIQASVVSGENVRPAGGDVAAGAAVLPTGTLLGPAQLAALAAAGVDAVSCARRPRVAVLVTGTELRAPGRPLGPGEIYESNGTMLSALLAAAGADVERLATVEDDEAAHRDALAHALEAAVVVSTGGVSVGPHDLVRRTEAALGVEEVFWGVAMRPGRPLAFGVRGRTLVFGLPGNPVSSLVGALLFVRPALLALQGAADPRPRWQRGELGAPARRNPARDDFVRAVRRETPEATVLTPIAGQESHMIVRAAAADSLAHVPRGEGALAAGAAVRYLPLTPAGC
jgi:molybdopterin molybdotransferase